MEIIVFIEGILIFSFFIVVFFISYLEKELRAAILALVLALFLPAPFLIPVLSLIPYPDWVFYGIQSIIIFPVIMYLFPVKVPVDYDPGEPEKRFDERDTMFSRRTLVKGTKMFEEYYRRHPEKLIPDNNFRDKPGLLKAGSKYYDPVLFAAADSIFARVDKLHSKVEGEVEKKKLEVPPERISGMLIKMALDWGAHSAGITELKDYHVYSVGGRGDRYGQVFKKEHEYAIAFTVEMDFDIMKSAPAAPTVVESAKQYLNSGLIAVQLAEFIRSLGYPARAHIDANYRVICPLVARDAGLGEIGRMGLLMTPRLGPRVRIAVVTTNMPLVPADRKPDPTVIDFCRKCKKCARVCPVQAISHEPDHEINGVNHWQINPEACYTFWCIAGTDCGRCVIVCPYSHPANWFHRLVRFGVRNSFLFRRLAVCLDDFFYGVKPKSRRI